MGNPLLCDLFVFVSRPGGFPDDGSIRFIILFHYPAVFFKGFKTSKTLNLLELGSIYFKRTTKKLHEAWREVLQRIIDHGGSYRVTRQVCFEEFKAMALSLQSTIIIARHGVKKKAVRVGRYKFMDAMRAILAVLSELVLNTLMRPQSHRNKHIYEQITGFQQILKTKNELRGIPGTGFEHFNETLNA